MRLVPAAKCGAISCAIFAHPLTTAWASSTWKEKTDIHRNPPNHPHSAFRDRPSSLYTDRAFEKEPSSWQRWESWTDEVAAASGIARNDRNRIGGHQHSRPGQKSRLHVQRRRGVLTDAFVHDVTEEKGGIDHELTRRLSPSVEPSPIGHKSGASQRLRTDLLSDYDRGAFPWEVAWSANAMSSEGEDGGDGEEIYRKGLNVEVGINFHRIFDVNLAQSTADFVVWFRQRWTDPRLAWDPADYSNITSVHFWIGDGSGPGGETSEIWTPDIELWNMEMGLGESLTDAPAIVTHTGSVFWSRPGHLMPVCKFKGLDDFPFDTLHCTVEIGSWAHSGLYIRSVPLDEGYTVGGSETAGEAFAEYQLADVKMRKHLYPPFLSAPEEDWPVLLYDITFHRSWQPYVRSFIVLQIILNLAAFSCFWLPPQCGERMGLAITSMLAAVTSELIVSSNLPNSAEMTWIVRFSLTSLAFASFALFETAVVLYFFYCTSDNLTPVWFKWLSAKYSKLRTRREAQETRSSGDCVPHSENASEGGSRFILKEKSLTHLSYDSKEAQGNHEARTDINAINDDVSSLDQDAVCGNGAPKQDIKEEGVNTKRGTAMSWSHEKGALNCTKPSSSLDIFCSNPGKPHNRLSSVSNPSQLPQVNSILARRDLSHKSSTSFRRHSGHDASHYKSDVEAENNLKWQTVARRIDDFSRVVFPLAYAIVMAVLLGPKR
eukprot:CAMPEP_0197441788 /NCGR_PEP_ID=MMETSP1175-20131217/7959_1 /TAXON_ID=1003142 /ORGANISM="Triceratium dubium, Strain CCMP147" /LENGTH=715 /DNA_ID=CAMNT_0042972119 /DNA_START=153 /DNA_END=2300 /DNA_ORIENTATION=+